MTKLFVIAGHGAGDSGATGHGYTEAERVRALASRIKALGGSNVTVGDTSRNWYKDNGISSLNISKDYKIIELHMDSASASSAKGGHVIIKSGFSADQYDKALASFIGSMFPGRSSLIAGRSDLANPKRAAAKGYNYRLLECCFITNKDDLNKFNNNLDAVAKGILSAFGIAVNGTSSSGGSMSTPSTGGGKKSVSEIVKEVIAGKWGNGDTRKKKLEAAGYNYSEVQAAVNAALGVGGSSSSNANIEQLAQDVIAGKYGNGEARKKALGSNYEAVQKRVNEILTGSGSGGKSIDTLAREVIRGDWGNGTARKNRLTAAGYDYNAVQKRVNELL